MRARLIVIVSLLALLAAVFSPAASAQDDEEVVVRIGLHAAEKNLNPPEHCGACHR